MSDHPFAALLLRAASQCALAARRYRTSGYTDEANKVLADEALLKAAAEAVVLPTPAMVDTALRHHYGGLPMSVVEQVHMAATISAALRAVVPS